MSSSDFVIEDGVLTEYTGEGGDVVIPEEVTSIDDDAFRNCKNLTSITIPDSVTSIGGGAFYNCTGLTEITVPEGVNKVGVYAFKGVKEITVYETLKTDLLAILGLSSVNAKETIVACDCTVLNVDGGIKYRAPVYSDGKSTYDILRKTCNASGKVMFNLSFFDANFKSITKSGLKADIADFRLNNPYELSDESREMYEKYLRRNGKKKDESPKSNEFAVKGTKLFKYLGNESTVIIPDGVTSIGDSAFSGSSVRELVIPEGVKTIEKNYIGYSTAFCRSLESISIPDSLTSMPYGAVDHIKDHLKMNQYEHGLYLGNSKNPYVCLVTTVNKDIKSITVPDGCRIICGYAFEGCLDLDKIELPDSLVRIEDQCPNARERINIYFRKSLKINLPKNYLKQAEKLPADLTYGLITEKWMNEATTEDYVWVYLYQGSKKLEEYCAKQFSDKTTVLDEMLAVCSANASKSAVKKMAEYTFAYKNAVGKDQISEVLKLAEKEKADSDEIKHLRKMIDKEDNTETDELEKQCMAKYDYNHIIDVIKKAGLNMSASLKKFPVLYKDNKKKASEFAVNCVIALYLEQFKGTEPNPVIIPEADEIANQFDETSFCRLISGITQTAASHVSRNTYPQYVGMVPKDRLVCLAGRFGDDNLLNILITGYKERACEKFYLDTKVETFSNYIKAAIMLNDSEKALDFCTEQGWKKQYATVHGKKVTDYLEHRDTLSEEDKLIEEAISLYEDTVTKISRLLDMDTTYNDPTVAEAPETAIIRQDNKLAEKFFATIRDNYKNKTRMGSYDRCFKPDELYDIWKKAGRLEEAHFGICLSVGLLVASYMFESKDISGRIVFCRDKWEYRGDYSESTRIALDVGPDSDKWKAYVDSGYEKYDM